MLRAPRNYCAEKIAVKTGPCRTPEWKTHTKTTFDHATDYFHQFGPCTMTRAPKPNSSRHHNPIMLTKTMVMTCCQKNMFIPALSIICENLPFFRFFTSPETHLLLKLHGFVNVVPAKLRNISVNVLCINLATRIRKKNIVLTARAFFGTRHHHVCMIPLPWDDAGKKTISKGPSSPETTRQANDFTALPGT